MSTDRGRFSRSLSAAFLSAAREKSLRWKSHASKLNKWHFFCAEFLGTATFIFMSCLGCLVDAFDDRPTIERISLNFGFAMMCSNMIFAHISQGHFNPTLTIAAMVLKKLAVIDAGVYISAQFLGAFFGFGLVYFIQNDRQSFAYRKQLGVGLCSPHINPNIHIYQACLVEFIISFILCFFACVRWDQYRNWHDSLSLTFGVVYICLIVAAYDYTEAHMNPARTLAPLVINMDWNKEVWPYFVSPTLAAILAPVTYRLFIPSDVFVGDTPELMQN